MKPRASYTTLAHARRVLDAAFLSFDLFLRIEAKDKISRVDRIASRRPLVGCLERRDFDCFGESVRGGDDGDRGEDRVRDGEGRDGDARLWPISSRMFNHHYGCFDVGASGQRTLAAAPSLLLSPTMAMRKYYVDH